MLFMVADNHFSLSLQLLLNFLRKIIIQYHFLDFIFSYNYAASVFKFFLWMREFILEMLEEFVLVVIRIVDLFDDLRWKLEEDISQMIDALKPPYEFTSVHHFHPDFFAHHSFLECFEIRSCFLRGRDLGYV